MKQNLLTAKKEKSKPIRPRKKQGTAKSIASSETYGRLGRIYKNKFTDAMNNNNELLDRVFIDKSLELI